MIVYTSGTTGNPKGVVHTHGSLEAMMIQMEEAWGWTKDDHIMNVLPLHHVHGIMNVLNTSLWSGAQCTLVNKYSQKGIWDLLLDEKDGIDHTVFMAVPTIYRQLIEHYENNGFEEQSNEIKQKLKIFRLMVSGSAPLPEKFMSRWKEITGHTLLERFGMTEVGMALTNPYGDVKGRLPGHVGHPFNGVKAALYDGESVHQKKDSEGELLIQSPCMFSRYHSNEDATAETFIESGGEKWFKTGDFASICPDTGSFKILGRLSQDIIKKQGYKISALEIEGRLLQHDDVSQSAVFGVPSEEFGDEFVAYIVLKEGGSVSDSAL